MNSSWYLSIHSICNTLMYSQVYNIIMHLAIYQSIVKWRLSSCFLMLGKWSGLCLAADLVMYKFVCSQKWVSAVKNVVCFHMTPYLLLVLVQTSSLHHATAAKFRKRIAQQEAQLLKYTFAAHQRHSKAKEVIGNSLTPVRQTTSSARLSWQSSKKAALFISRHLAVQPVRKYVLRGFARPWPLSDHFGVTARRIGSTCCAGLPVPDLWVTTLVWLLSESLRSPTPAFQA